MESQQTHIDVMALQAPWPQGVDHLMHWETELSDLPMHGKQHSPSSAMADTDYLGCLIVSPSLLTPRCTSPRRHIHLNLHSLHDPQEVRGSSADISWQISNLPCPVPACAMSMKDTQPLGLPSQTR